MKITTVYTSENVLKDYVDYYYILNPGKEFLNESYFAYPNNGCAVSFFCDDFSLPEKYSLILKESGTNYFTGIFGGYLNPVSVSLRGCVSFITIVFKPLGVNHFIESNYGDFGLSFFKPFANWDTKVRFFREIFSGLQPNEVGSRLDSFLLEKLKGFDHPGLQEALKLIQETDVYEIKTLEKLMHVNRKNLLRWFHTHIGQTPTNFKRITRFRAAIEKKHTTKANFTKLTYDTGFYDQAHLIREFRRLTGNTPVKMFANVSYIENTPLLFSINPD